MKLYAVTVIAGNLHKKGNKMVEKFNPLRVFAFLSVLLMALFITKDDIFIKPQPVVEEIKKVAKAVDPRQLTCLAKNIYFEAGSESTVGQAAVARVVINRIRHGFGSNPCSVVHQATVVNKENDEGEIQKVKLCQFSWVCEGKDTPTNNYRYNQAKKVAYDVLAYDAYDDVISKSTLFFHNTSVKPNWPYQESKQIGNHIFYSKHKKKPKKTIPQQKHAVNTSNKEGI